MGTTIWVDVFLFLTSSMILIWKTNLSMLEIRKIWVLSPFYVFGILICFKAIFVFFELFENIVWGFLEMTFFMSLVLVFIILRRENK